MLVAVAAPAFAVGATAHDPAPGVREVANTTVGNAQGAAGTASGTIGAHGSALAESNTAAAGNATTSSPQHRAGGSPPGRKGGAPAQGN
ncbi:MAG TPA: hypothetical protein VMU08_08665 [Rhizomicrobium sp.]|nr:hypothetical protein [Rhizomicrobium sp.]